ncbi:hypothetical protein BS17DRAFT_879186 [Gyrodon lividus]|nr:hypothetical protein BS17DRAFT_879186 [Gyrodon lividus]
MSSPDASVSSPPVVSSTRAVCFTPRYSLLARQKEPEGKTAQGKEWHQTLKFSVQVCFNVSWRIYACFTFMQAFECLAASIQVTWRPLRRLTFEIAQHENQRESSSNLEKYKGYGLVGGKRDQNIQTLSLRPDTAQLRCI